MALGRIRGLAFADVDTKCFHKDLIPKLVLQLQLHEVLLDTCKVLAWNEAQGNPSQNAVMAICMSVPILFFRKRYLFCDFSELN